MSEPQVLMPVNCPECGAESLFRLSVSAAADALTSDHPVQLRSDCHARVWIANPAEREQMRGYLGAACIDAIRQYSDALGHGSALGATAPRYSILLHDRPVP